MIKRHLFAVYLVLMWCSALVRAEEVKTVTYSPHAAHKSCLMNMGPTGARAWMRGYHFVVIEIDLHSPAEGILEPADIVIATDGTTFGEKHDPRITLGNAIGKAEADGKPLVLTVLRKGSRTKVELPLPKLGDWSEAFPVSCEKSERVLDEACQLLLNAQMPDGQIITDGNIGTTHGGLLMLANPNPKFLDGARRAAYQVAKQEYHFASVCNNWPMGYGGILLAEYFLATGDDTVLPRLKDIVDIMSSGQMRCGGWGHTSPGGAYGALNQVGVICAITLTLANECGVDVPQDTLRRAQDFFGQYAEIGAVPYGDHLPYTGSLDANGRSASAAILMHLAGRNHEAKAFSDSVALSAFEREEGHTGGFFSMMWGPLATALAGPEKLKSFMDYQKWYYNLARTWQGGLVLLPYQEALTRFDNSSYTDNEVFTTGGMGLAFALPHQRLRILGAPRSVFSPSAKLDSRLQKARDRWVAKEWAKCDALLNYTAPEDLSNERDRRALVELLSAREIRREATKSLLLEIESNLDNRAAYRAYHQYEALKRSLGAELDERFVEMDKRMESAARAMDSGKKFFDAYHELRALSFQGWVAYGPRAEELIRGLPSIRVPVWEPLSPASSTIKQSWRTTHFAKDAQLPDGWMTPGFNDSGWKEGEGIAIDPKAGVSIAARRLFRVTDDKGDSLRVRLQTVRPAHTRVYLNGQLVVDAVRGQRGGYASILLDESALGLVKKGWNVLAVSSTKQGTGGNHLDVSLEICRESFEARAPKVVIADEALVVDAGKDVDNTLRVREVKNRIRGELQEAFNEREIPDLLGMLGLSVAAQRRMAEAALVTKGAEGIAAVAFVLEHEDWKVRSSACNVMAASAGKYSEKPDSAEMKMVAKNVKTLMRLLEDEHRWVQVRAASALRMVGEPARECLPVLAKLVTDDDEWVRTEALATLERLAPDPKDKVAAAMASLRMTDSAFRGTRIAYRMLKDNPSEEDDGRLDALAVTLSVPPQGGGGRTLIKPLLDYAVSLDPDGKTMIPILLEAARDKKLRYSRQQANPRARIIELLAEYGDKAKERAIPVLQEVLKSDDRHDQGQHGKAKEALEAFGVPVAEEE